MLIASDNCISTSRASSNLSCMIFASTSSLMLSITALVSGVVIFVDFA